MIKTGSMLSVIPGLQQTVNEYQLLLLVLFLLYFLSKRREGLLNPTETQDFIIYSRNQCSPCRLVGLCLFLNGKSICFRFSTGGGHVWELLGSNQYHTQRRQWPFKKSHWSVFSLCSSPLGHVQATFDKHCFSKYHILGQTPRNDKEWQSYTFPMDYNIFWTWSSSFNDIEGAKSKMSNA